MGEAAVTNAVVLAGSYALSEFGFLGFDLTLACVGGTLIGDTVKVTDSAVVTCTFTNALPPPPPPPPPPPRLTLEKRVVGGTAVATDWTLTPMRFPSGTTISGTSRDPAITNGEVPQAH